MKRSNGGGRRADYKAAVQIDAFAGGGRGACSTREARTLLQMVEEVAALHDSQGRPDAVISITRKQAAVLSAKLRLPTGEMSWRGHPVRVLEDEVSNDRRRSSSAGSSPGLHPEGSA